MQKGSEFNRRKIENNNTDKGEAEMNNLESSNVNNSPNNKNDPKKKASESNIELDNFGNKSNFDLSRIAVVNQSEIMESEFAPIMQHFDSTNQNKGILQGLDVPNHQQDDL